MTDYSNLTAHDLETMSDEDFAKLDPSKFVDVQDEPVPESEVAEVPTEVNEDIDQPEPPAEEEVPEVSDSNENGGEAGSSHAEVTNEPGTDPQTPTPVEEKSEPETKPDETNVDPKEEFFNKVTAKFNANGREFQISNPDDVVSLMQKGLHYNQKMAAMKPSLKIIKALQEKGIESVEQLGYLFDLQDKKPEAIAKLVQESGIETFDLNEEKAAAYTASVPHVSDQSVEFDIVVNSLKGNEHFNTVAQELQTFDEQSKEKVFNNPRLLEVLTSHVQNGQYQQIVSRLQTEQALGRLAGMPFIEAYGLVGDAMFAQQQAPAPVAQPVVNVPAPVAQVPVPVATKPNTVNNTARQAAAAANTATAKPPKHNLTKEDLWNMSEEDFAKIDPRFL